MYIYDSCFGPISVFHTHFSVLSPFVPVSAFYPHFSVSSPIQSFILISMFYPHFSVLSPFQRCIPISVFYPHFSVLSSFQCFIPISALYPHFSVLSNLGPGPSRWDGDEDPGKIHFIVPKFWGKNRMRSSVSAIQFQRFIPTPIITHFT